VRKWEKILKESVGKEVEEINFSRCLFAEEIADIKSVSLVAYYFSAYSC
jgi:hypothetical protein